MEGNLDLTSQKKQDYSANISARAGNQPFLKTSKRFNGVSKKTLIIGIILLLTVATLGFLAFAKFYQQGASKMSRSSLVVKGDDAGKQNGAPTIAHPINGLLYSSKQAREWESRRPLAVMINNHSEARPQKGLSVADIIYEAVAEGGISRFVAIFHSRLPEVVGPVRSARVYYIDWAKEYDAWYAHWGYAQTANEANAFAHMQQIFVSSIESAKACQYDRSLDRAIEHTLYCNVDELYQTGYDLYPDQPVEFRPLTAWQFKDKLISPGESDVAKTIKLNFWELPEYAVEWRYLPDSNSYQRYQGGEKQTDALNSEDLRAGNIIVEFMKETHLNDGKNHLLYDTIGTGDALVFLDGRVVKAEWRRLAYGDRTVITDKATGKEIAFNRGQIWVEVVPERNKASVSYQ